MVVPFDLLTLEYRGVRLFRNVRITTSVDTAHQHAAVRTSVLAPCDQSILRNVIHILLLQFECLFKFCVYHPGVFPKLNKISQFQSNINNLVCSDLDIFTRLHHVKIKSGTQLCPKKCRPCPAIRTIQRPLLHTYKFYNIIVILAFKKPILTIF